MNHLLSIIPAVFVACGINSCSNLTAPAPGECSRVLLSVEGVTFWDHHRPLHQKGQRSNASDATYVLEKKDAGWYLSEHSVRVDIGVHHHVFYGVISAAEANSILQAVIRLESRNKGEIATKDLPPGGPSERPLFELTNQLPHSIDRISYVGTDRTDADWLHVLEAFRSVARNHGTVLPLFIEPSSKKR